MEPPSLGFLIPSSPACFHCGAPCDYMLYKGGDYAFSVPSTAPGIQRVLDKHLNEGRNERMKGHRPTAASTDVQFFNPSSVERQTDLPGVLNPWPSRTHFCIFVPLPSCSPSNGEIIKPRYKWDFNLLQIVLPL